MDRLPLASGNLSPAQRTFVLKYVAPALRLLVIGFQLHTHASPTVYRTRLDALWLRPKSLNLLLHALIQSLELASRVAVDSFAFWRLTSSWWLLLGSFETTPGVAPSTTNCGGHVIWQWFLIRRYHWKLLSFALFFVF